MLHVKKATQLSSGCEAHFAIFGREILPVETSSFKTINFQERQHAILYSTTLTACPMIVIKNYNEATKKYDNIVTMAHFSPINTVSAALAKSSIEKILQDFRDKGGILNEHTSIQLFGGGIQSGRSVSDSRNMLADCLRSHGLNFKDHSGSINIRDDRKTQGCEIFVNCDGTQILQRTTQLPSMKIDATLLTRPIESMPCEFLMQVREGLLAIKYYGEFMGKRSSLDMIIALSRGGSVIDSMDNVATQLSKSVDGVGR